MAGCCECVCVCVESLAGRRGVWAIGDDCFRFDRSVRTCQQPRAPRPLRRGSSSLSGCVDDDDDDDVFLLMCTSPEQRCLRLYEADDYDYCSLQVHVLVQRSLHHCMWLPSCAVLCCAVQGCAVQCWEAKASASHLLLRHFLQLLLSREIAAPKLLNSSFSSSDSVASATRLLALRCCDDFVPRAAAAAGANGRTSVRDRLGVR